MFSSVKTKTNSYFALKVVERGDHSFSACLMNLPYTRPEYNFSLNMDRLSGRNDVTSDKVISDRPSDKTFLKKKIRTSRVFVALKRIYGATLPW